MRDGVTLRADVYRPDAPGPRPVIVARTPYGKTDHYELQFLEPLLAARRGFIAVRQDVPGSFALVAVPRPVASGTKGPRVPS
jgi:predicted acyl esterase